MAIKLSDQYPGRANPPSVDYPNGSIKNRSAPGVLDGTPLDQAWANDKEGFFQGILAEAEITADGQPDKVGASQYLQALKSVVKKEAPQSTQPIQGSFKNLKSSATGTNSFITVSLDQCILEDESGGTIKISGINLSIDSSTSGLGGLDSGSIASNTWYSIWVISDGTNVSGLISLSATSPNMPAGYTHKARTGWIRTSPNSNKFPIGFVQRGSKSDWIVPVVIGSGSMGTWSPVVWAALSVASAAPPTAVSVRGFINGGTATQNHGVMAAPNNGFSESYSTINPPPVDSGTGTNEAIARGSRDFDFVLQSTNIYGCSNFAAASIRILGWEDSL